jgi:biopolymer transport protein ExbD|tara:strand:+ start:545 stop:967 length:423 start_codon:yes stop_codon:yes gene_type:complete
MAKKKKGRKKRGIPEIPVNSFADIAFLLIIFFLVATTMDRMTGNVSELPKGETNEKQQDKTPTVQLHHDKITFQDAELTVSELRDKLAELKLDEREGDAKVVAFEATGDVKYQDYFDTMCTISAAGGVIAIVKEDKKSGK